tara:strand:+ start:164 stop:439 length:276 start_codon:yes stop_codon:yes gene_type:complete
MEIALMEVVITLTLTVLMDAVTTNVILNQAMTVIIIITVLIALDVSQIVVQIFAQEIIITTIIPVTVKVFAHGVLQMVSNIVLMDVIQMDV